MSGLDMLVRFIRLVAVSIAGVVISAMRGMEGILYVSGGLEESMSATDQVRRKIDQGGPYRCHNQDDIVNRWLIVVYYIDSK